MNRVSAVPVVHDEARVLTGRVLDKPDARQGGGEALMTSTVRSASRIAAGATVIALLVWRVGTGPFVTGLRTVSLTSLLAAGTIGGVTTVCAAWRWSVVARNLDVPLPLRGAIAAYYRSQLLNSVLPGGILGDVNRGVRHGRDTARLAPALRAVTWERALGLVVQLALALVVVAIVPSPAQRYLPAVAVSLGVAAIAALLLLRTSRPRGRQAARALAVIRSDVSHGLLRQGSWLPLGVASVLVVAGHTATYVVAARTAGVTMSTSHLLPLSLVVLVAMSLPVNVGGWGPREGVSAWVFAAAGLGAGRGVATATVYGVMALAATLPGVVVMFASWWRRPTAAPAALSRTHTVALAVGSGSRG
jgi:glycosyltransferase 2 family protein